MKYVLDSYVGIKWLIQVAFEASGKEDRFVMVGRRNGYASSISIGLGLPGSFQTRDARARGADSAACIDRSREGTRGTGAGIPTLGRPSASGATPASIRFTAAMAASIRRLRLPAVIPQMTSQAVKSFAPVGDRSPAASVQAEVQSTGGRIDGPRVGRSSRPAKGALRLEDREDRLRECDRPRNEGCIAS